MDAAASGAGVTFTATFSDRTFRVTIAASSGSFELLFSRANSPWQILGFANADTASAASQTGANVLQLDQPGFVLVEIRELDNGSNYINSSTGISAAFYAPLNANGGEIAIYRRSDFPQRMVFCTPIPALAQLSVRLRDPDGRARSLNGSNWQMLLEVETA